MTELLIAQFLLWIVASFFLFLTHAADENLDDLPKLYSIIHFNTVHNWFEDTTMYDIWIEVFTVLFYGIIIIPAFWLWLNLLPFKLVYEILSGKLVNGTLSFIFQDKSKV